MKGDLTNLHGIPILRDQISFNITNYKNKYKTDRIIKNIIIHDTGNKAKNADDYMH
jgi:hypothetical protein